MSLPKTITFDPDLRDFVFDTFKMYDSQGMVCYKEDGEYVLGLDEQPVPVEEFAGIIKTDKGVRLVRSDLPSLIALSDHLEKNL